MFSITADERDHSTALTREFRPNNSFSSPDSLQFVKSIGKFMIAFRSTVYSNRNAQVLDFDDVGALNVRLGNL